MANPTLKKSGYTNFAFEFNVKDSTNKAVKVGVQAVAIDDDLIATTIADQNTGKLVTDTAVKSYVTDELGKIAKLELVSVDKLPNASADTMNKIYLVPKKSSKTNNAKDEYITVKAGDTYSWELIGDTAVDLTDYAKTSDVNTELDKKVDKVEGKVLSTNDYTTAEQTKLAGIATGATKVEKSETNGNIKINGTETTVFTETPAYTTIKVDKVQAEADASHKVLEIAAGNGITVEAKTATDGGPKITISATGVEAEPATPSVQGTMYEPTFSNGCIDMTNTNHTPA